MQQNLAMAGFNTNNLSSIFQKGSGGDPVANPQHLPGGPPPGLEAGPANHNSDPSAFTVGAAEVAKCESNQNNLTTVHSEYLNSLQNPSQEVHRQDNGSILQNHGHGASGPDLNSLSNPYNQELLSLGLGKLFH